MNYVSQIIYVYPSENWIEIYDGKNSSSPRIGDRFCGSIAPRTIVSNENELLIRFQSRSHHRKAVFKLQVEEIGNNKISLTY